MCTFGYFASLPGSRPITTVTATATTMACQKTTATYQVARYWYHNNTKRTAVLNDCQNFIYAIIIRHAI